ncbi:MAG: hypothetical protein KDB27_28160 [Planctomycetales bacterium]|nr:hypothetical protein [Planctomycetales bacterium]
MLYRQIVCSFLVVVFSSSVSHAMLVLDQENDFVSAVGSTASTTSRIGQTFTVGLAGSLDRIDLRMTRVNIFGDPGPAILTLHTTAAGLPSGELGSVQIPASMIATTGQAFVTFDVSSLGITAVPGQVLAFDLSTNSGTGVYAVPNSINVDNYANGTAVSKDFADPWQAQIYDHSFRTFVSVPEPNAFVCLGVIGLVIVGAKKLKKRRHSC